MVSAAHSHNIFYILLGAWVTCFYIKMLLYLFKDYSTAGMRTRSISAEASILMLL